VTVSETDPVNTAVVQVTRSHHAFGQVAALFDDYRAHYGRPPSLQVTHGWLHDQLAQHRMTIAAAIHAGQACGFMTTTVMPASLMLGTAWSIRDLYVAPQQRRSGIAHALLQHVVEGARAAGAYRVSLQTEAGNTPRSGSTRQPASSRSAAWNCSASRFDGHATRSTMTPRSL
jgi:ribosomal protein S18 acetylase RimI-like enzyme